MIKKIVAFGLTHRPIILLALLLFVGGGMIAVSQLNVEAYPNPAPVILEITAQAPGLSAEEMERYYTTPMEIGLYSTPGIANIRSTSFYGLSFVRVTFKYGLDFYFAYTQAALSLQQNVNLPASQVPQIQQSSLVGEVYRYQLVGPPHFGRCRTGWCCGGSRPFPAWWPSTAGAAPPRNSRSRRTPTRCRPTASPSPR
jgi:cobalt-zinc-cadmium resistance protein CzcA